MKMYVLVGPEGAVVGAARSETPQKGAKAESSNFQSGMVPGPGQSIHEVEVPEELAQLEGQTFLQKLADVDTVKAVLSTIPTAGQAGSGNQIPLSTVSSAGPTAGQL